jgi:hypothetical protein
MLEKKIKTSVAKPEHPYRLIAIWNREWPIAKEHPTACICSFFAGCGLIFALYSYFVIPGKDSTIQSLQTQLSNHSSETQKIGVRDNEPLKSSGTKAQWFLKIRSIEVIPKTSNDHPQTMPFRIVAVVNSQNYSFPSTQLCFNGEGQTQGETVPLSGEPEKYLVQFMRQNINRNLLRTTITNSSASTPGGITDSFEITNLPAVKTNEIVIQDLQTRIDTGTTRIIYEITNH